MVRRRVRGDLFEYPTDRGSAFLQYCFDTPFYGEMVRVIEGLFTGETPSLESLVERPTLFWAPVPLGSALYRKEVRYLANRPFPTREQIPPWMKGRGAFNHDGLVLSWSIFTFDEQGKYAQDYWVTNRTLTRWEMRLSRLHGQSHDLFREDVEAQARPEEEP